MDRIRASGPSVSYNSTSGTSSVLCTYRKWAESTWFSAISCQAAGMSMLRRCRGRVVLGGR